MVLAMMLPLFVPALKGISASSFRAERSSKVSCAAFGFVLTALLVGIVAIPLTFLFRTAISVGPSIIGPILLFSLAAWWQGTRARARIVARCHQPFFPSSTNGAVRYGMEQGYYCSLSCMPAMLATMGTGQGLLPMFLVTHIMLSERLAHRPSQRRFQAALILIGACCGLVAAITLR